MQPQDVAELLRATASDADAVAQYLLSIDAEELNGLLDRFAAHETKKKSEQQRGDWLALVHLLLRSESTRLRTSTRIVHLVWNGLSSEFESMQWLTEISLGYLGAVQEDDNNPTAGSNVKTRMRVTAIADEIRMLLRILLELLDDGLQDYGPRSRRVLPQVLGLVPILLGVLADLATTASDAAKSSLELHENLGKLIALPWTPRTVPFLLDLLKESASLMSPGNWLQVQVLWSLWTQSLEHLELMLTGHETLPSETLNPILRECIAIGSVARNCHWVNLARHLFRQLPVRLRQEAEFNLQMCLHQSQHAVALVCESIRISLQHELGITTGSGEERPEDAFRVTLDWRDLIFLFHVLKVSKPVLHHRTTSSRIATDATVFTEIEKLTWSIFQLELSKCTTSATPRRTLSPASGDRTKYLTDKVSQVLTFGGTQVHAREWKALLLMDFALFWMEESERTRFAATTIASDCKSVLVTKETTAYLLLLAVFQTTPEVRAELLSCLFEGTKHPSHVKFTAKALDQLFRSHPGALGPHVNAIQDWLSVLFQSHFKSAYPFFVMASRLATVHKDLYSFLMVFLRKLLLLSNHRHQQFAIELWCSWLEQGLAFDALQEEEIVSALKNSLQVCQEIQAWALGRLERVFRAENPETFRVQLRRSSWEEMHRLLTNQLSRFLESPPSTSSTQQQLLRVGSGIDDGDDEEEDDDEHTDFATRFRIGSLAYFYRQNANANGASAVGLVFQKTLSCLLAFEAAAFATDTCKDGLPVPVIETGGMIHWVTDFVSNVEFFFHWISQSSSNEDFLAGGSSTKAPRGRATTGVQALEKKVMWQLLARIGIGCALCTVAMDHVLGYRDDDHEPTHRDGGAHGERQWLSVWALLEAQFALHRLLRKLITVHGAAIDVKLSKEYLAASIAGVSSVMDARSALVIAQINTSLESVQDQADEPRPVSSAASAASFGISFDGVLFALDSCCNSSVADDRSFLRVVPSESQQPHQIHATGDLDIFKSLLTLYFNVRDRVFAAPEEAATSHSPRPMFTVYAESLVVKFPKSMRHLVTTPRNAKHVVLLDVKAAEDVLVRVFAAIGRVLDAQVETHGVNDTDCHLQRLLNHDDDDGDNQQEQSPVSGFIALAVMLLDDLRAFMSFDELTKLKLTSVLLVKRLCDHGASAHTSTRVHAFARDVLRLSYASYAIMCDHVVYHVPLLRVLLSLVFSVHIGKYIEAVVELREVMKGVLLAAGFEVSKSVFAPSSSRTTARPSSSAVAATFAKSSGDSKHKSTKERSSAKRRKRLRQLSFDSCDNGKPENDPERIEADGFADDSSGTVPQPHLTSQDAQSAAIHFLVTFVDAAHATLLKHAANGTRHSSSSDNEQQRGPSSQSVLLYLRSSHSVLLALLTTKDITWMQARVLAKVLSTIEYGLRLAKAWIAVLTNSSDAHENATNRVAIDVLDACVHLALHGRMWISALKESIKDAATKTRLSATALKIDVFLLNAPQLVDAYAKELELTESEKGRLNAMLSSVTKQITPTDKSRSSLKAETPRKKAHMIGVVPIVKKRKTRLRSRHPYIDECLREEDGDDAFVDLEDFIA